MLDRSEVGKRGYLDRDFRLVHLKDSLAQKIDYHYHEFDKLVIFLGGKVTYVVEGVTYFLKPWDIVLIQHNLIHRPIIDPAEPYERVVVWLGREWLENRSDPGEALDTCFSITQERGFHLLRFAPQRRLWYMDHIQRMEEALREEDFGAARMADTLCQQLLIAVNRDILLDRTAQDQVDSYRIDPKIEEILRYIAAHLTEDLTVEALANRVYLSRYYLMHRFKEVRGGFVLQSLPFDVRKSTMALFMAEVLYRLVREYDEPNQALFDFVWNCVGALDSMDEGVANFHLWFLANLSRFLGFCPGNDYSADDWFDIREGLYTKTRPQHVSFMTQECTRILRDMMECDVRCLAEIGLNRTQRVEFLNAVLVYFGYHLDAISAVQSVRILREVF